METIKHIDKKTPNGAQLNLDALYNIAPSCFTEAKGDDGELHHVVDFTKLRQLLGAAAVEDAPEVYDFTWVGKRAAMREAAAPIRKTLRPCPEESVDWDTTQNLYIEGDNLEVLKLLQNSYMGKVKMIYIDPPYNTGNDFVYHDDFAQSTDEYDEANRDEEGNRYRKNTDSNGRFHSDWCSMMYSRLLLSRSLLSPNGVIFISIGQEEINTLLFICDEVFGAKNRTGLVTRVTKTASNNGSFFAPSTDYVLCYAKNLELAPKFSDKVDESLYKKVETEGVHKGEKYRDDVALYQAALNDLRPNQKYFIECPDGSKVIPPCSKLDEIMREGDGRWRWSKDKYLENKHLLVFKETKTSPLLDQNGNKAKYNIYTKSYLSERQESGTLPRDIWDSFINRRGADYLKKMGISFDFSKPWELIKYMIEISKTDKDAIILDFFSGSATTADAVMRMNISDGGKRKFIMVQIKETISSNSQLSKESQKTICDIGKKRIRIVGNKLKEELGIYNNELDTGFRVFKCDESNYKDVAFTPKDYSQEELDMFVDNIKDDRTDLDLLFDCMLRWGVQLSMPMSKTVVDGCTVYNVEDGNLVACLSGTVTEAVIDAIADMNPMRLIFRDSSFKEAASKMNLFELFKQKCGWSETEVRNNVRVI